DSRSPREGVRARKREVALGRAGTGAPRPGSRIAEPRARRGSSLARVESGRTLSPPARPGQDHPLAVSSAATAPRCSIIVPVFNHAELTRRCLETLLEQTA